MKLNLEIVSGALEQVINDEPAPSFRSPEFADLIAAIRGISNEATTPEAHQRLLFEQIGRKAVLLLLDRLTASMGAERTVSIMRGGDDAAVV